MLHLGILRSTSPATQTHILPHSPPPAHTSNTHRTPHPFPYVQCIPCISYLLTLPQRLLTHFPHIPQTAPPDHTHSLFTLASSTHNPHLHTSHTSQKCTLTYPQPPHKHHPHTHNRPIPSTPPATHTQSNLEGLRLTISKLLQRSISVYLSCSWPIREVFR